MSLETLSNSSECDVDVLAKAISSVEENNHPFKKLLATAHVEHLLDVAKKSLRTRIFVAKALKRIKTFREQVANAKPNVLNKCRGHDATGVRFVKGLTTLKELRIVIGRLNWAASLIFGGKSFSED